MEQPTLDSIWNIIGPAQHRTKAPYHRARTLYNACIDIINNNKDGVFCEYGVWRGGLIGIMGVLSEYENNNRKVWAFDSFQGMSAPDPTKDLLDGETEAIICFTESVQLHNFNLNDFKETCFNMLKINADTINIIEGWAENTLPAQVNNIDSIAILRIDFDFYEPTKQVLELYYSKVIIGGYIILDDYGCWKGARQAIDEFRAENNITTELIQTPCDDYSPQPSMIVGTEFYWIKE